MLCVVLWRSNLGLWQEAWFATGFLTRYLIVLPQRNAFVVSLGKGLGLSHYCFRTGFAFVLCEHSMNILNYSHRCHHISVISVISIHFCFGRDGFDGLHSLCCFLVTFGDVCICLFGFGYGCLSYGKFPFGCLPVDFLCRIKLNV
jgi:hypothetical protein